MNNSLRDFSYALLMLADMLLVMTALPAVSAQAQTVDGQILTQFHPGAGTGGLDQLRVSIELAAAPSIDLGSASLMCIFNAEALAIPSSPGLNELLIAGTDYQFEEPFIGDAGSGKYYGPSTVTTFGQSNRVSINLVLEEIDSGQPLPATFTLVVTLFFDIKDSEETPDLTWILPDSEDPNPTVVYLEDNRTEVALGTFLIDPALPPVADAGSDQTVLAGQMVTLDGSGSFDPNGDSLTYQWALAGPDNPALSDDTVIGPTFCAAAAGTYTGTLTVSDGALESEPDDVEIEALEADEALDMLAAAIEELGPDHDGALDDDQQQALTHKLSQAKKLFGKGNTSEAFAVVADFRQRLLDLESDSVISVEQWTAIAESADGYISEPGAPCTDGAPVKIEDLERESSDIPTSFSLSNHPNPFNPTTQIVYTLPEGLHVRLVVYDVLGREVVRLVDDQRPAGRHVVRFEAAGMPSGMYLYRIEAGAFMRTRPMLLLR